MINRAFIPIRIQCYKLKLELVKTGSSAAKYTTVIPKRIPAVRITAKKMLPLQYARAAFLLY